MPKSLDIHSGTQTDRGLILYQRFVEDYNRGYPAQEALERLRNIPQDAESLFLRKNKDIRRDDWALGKTAFFNIVDYGCPTWYEWCARNWGTKWNAMDTSIDDNTLHFNTAWSAPHPVVAKLAEMYPDVLISHKWADEDIGYNCGIATYKNGDVSEMDDLEGDEAFNFSCELWGYDPDKYRREFEED